MFVVGGDAIRVDPATRRAREAGVAARRHRHAGDPRSRRRLDHRQRRRRARGTLRSVNRSWSDLVRPGRRPHPVAVAPGAHGHRRPELLGREHASPGSPRVRLDLPLAEAHAPGTGRATASARAVGAAREPPVPVLDDRAQAAADVQSCRRQAQIGRARASIGAPARRASTTREPPRARERGELRGGAEPLERASTAPRPAASSRRRRAVSAMFARRGRIELAQSGITSCLTRARANRCRRSSGPRAIEPALAQVGRAPPRASPRAAADQPAAPRLHASARRRARRGEPVDHGLGLVAGVCAVA